MRDGSLGGLVGPMAKSREAAGAGPGRGGKAEPARGDGPGVSGAQPPMLAAVVLCLRRGRHRPMPVLPAGHKTGASSVTTLLTGKRTRLVLGGLKRCFPAHRGRATPELGAHPLHGLPQPARAAAAPRPQAALVGRRLEGRSGQQAAPLSWTVLWASPRGPGPQGSRLRAPVMVVGGPRALAPGWRGAPSHMAQAHRMAPPSPQPCQALN